MTPKETLYDMLKQYLSNKIDTKKFCDIYSVMYALKVDDESLTIKERKVFSDLCGYTERFSPYEEDLKLYKVYYDEKTIREKAEDAARLLDIIK